MRILIVEDNVTIQKVLLEYFKITQINVEIVDSFTKFQTLSLKNYDWALVDLDLERELAGLDIIKTLSSEKIASVVFSGHEEVELIKKAYDLGARDYLVKPFSKKSMDSLVERMSFVSRSNFDKEIAAKFFISSISFLEELKRIENSLLSKRPLLLTGETGVGKTHFASLLHEYLFKKKTAFVHINCAQLNEALLESELFGHVKGAFTGAVENKIGKIELAHNGTLFLDEVLAMPERIQQKLLIALEKKAFTRVGDNKEIKSDFFLISATCDSIEDEINQKKFRKDLYFRIKGESLHIPSLKNRPEDIKQFIHYKLRNASRKILIKDDVSEKMLNYPWPGNMRELNGVLDSFLNSLKSVVEMSDLPKEIQEYDKKSIELEIPEGLIEYAEEYGLSVLVKNLEKIITKEVLRTNKNNIRETIKKLKISSNTYYRIMNFMEDNVEK